LLFGPRLVLEVATQFVTDYAGPSVAGSEIPRGFRDLRTVARSVKDTRFAFSAFASGWIEVN